MFKKPVPLRGVTPSALKKFTLPLKPFVPMAISTKPPATAVSPLLVVAGFMVSAAKVPALPVSLSAPAVISALTLMLRAAVSVRVFLVQPTVSLTLRSPTPLVVEPRPEAMVTLLVVSAVLRVAPLMSPEGVVPVTVPVLSAAIAKSLGSISQLPLRPMAALVSMRALFAIRTLEAEVSTKPPSPPALPARALRLPLTSVTLASWDRSAIRVTVPPLPAEPGAASALMLPLWVMRSLAARRMLPPLLTRPLASTVPLLLTTPPCKRLAAWAERMIKPPGALTAWPLSTRVAMVDGVTKMSVRRLPSN